MIEKEMVSVGKVARTGSSINTTSSKETKKCELRQCLEVALLCVLIGGVWCVLSLPVIFYQLQVSEDSLGAQNNSVSTNGTVLIENYPSNPNGTSGTLLECTNDFYQENDSSICTPSCYTWTQFSKHWSTFVDVVNLITASSGFLVAVAIIILSCLFHKRMLTFPSIFIVYLMINILINTFIFLVGHMDRNSLFCSSKSLSESLTEVTSFCVIFGILYTYTAYQIALWWLFHITAIFWKVVFPIHAQSCGKVKWIHLTAIILGILLPLVPVITPIADFALDLQNQSDNSTSQPTKSLFSRGLGFGPNRFPPTLCLARDPDSIFYSFVFNVGVIVATGCSLLIIIIWTIQKNSRKIKEKKKVMFKFGTAEKKLLFVFCFTLVLDVMFLISIILSGKNASELTGSYQRYFLCEQGGHNPSNPCSRSEIENLTHPSLEMLTSILQALLPCVYLLYVVNIQEIKDLCRKKVVHTTS